MKHAAFLRFGLLMLVSAFFIVSPAFAQTRIFEYNVTEFNDPGNGDPNTPGGVPDAQITSASPVYYDVTGNAFVSWATVATFTDREVWLIGDDGGQYGIFTGFSPGGPNRLISNGFTINSPGRAIGSLSIDANITLEVAFGLLGNTTGGANSLITTVNGFEINNGTVSVPVEIIGSGNPVISARGGGTNQLSGTLTNNVTSFTQFTATATNPNRNLTLAGNITGSAGIAFSSPTNNQSVFLNYAGTWDYTGATEIRAAADVTVRLDQSNVLPTATTLSFGDAVTADRGGVLDLNNQDLTVGNLLSVNAPKGSIQNNAASVGTSTLTIGGSADGTFALAILDGSGDGIVALTRGGSGTTTLTADNSYTGATQVTNAGTLLINGDQSAATGAVTVDAGATLGGTGTIGGATTVAGTLMAGNSTSIGTLTLSDSLSMLGDSELRFEFLNSGTAGTTCDQWIGPELILPGSGTITLRIVGLGGHDVSLNDSFTLFNGLVTNFSVDRFSIINESDWTGGWALSEGSLVLTAVPEPNQGLLLGLGLAAILFLRARKRGVSPELRSLNR